MTWLEDTSLRDLDDSTVIEATCLACLHTWLLSPVQLLLRVDHRDVRLDEVADNLPCPRPGCRHVGVRLLVLKNEAVSSAGSLDRPLLRIGAKQHGAHE